MLEHPTDILELLDPLLENPYHLFEQLPLILENTHFIRTFPGLLEQSDNLLEIRHLILIVSF